MKEKIVQCLRQATAVLFLSLLSAQVAAQASAQTSANAAPKEPEGWAEVKQYCGVCHKIPPPDVMPRYAWPHAVRAMADLAKIRFKTEFINEEVGTLISNFYVRRAPEELPTLPYYEDTNPLEFKLTDLAPQSEAPMVVNINPVVLDKNIGTEFLIADAETDEIKLLAKFDDGWQEVKLTDARVPVKTTVADYDLDGDNDILIAVLGAMPPSDWLVGEVVVLEQIAPNKYVRKVILTGVGRVTDVEVLDVDKDGDLDIAVAVYGGGVVGEMLWLEYQEKDKYKAHQVLNGSGALSMIPVDLNKDGHIDFVTLIAQEYELVIAMMNDGKGQFKQVHLAQAPHPMFGSTALKVVDLDGDDDMDIVFANGDANDLHMDPKPYHGVQWIENTGNLKFVYREIGRFYGAAAIEIGDLDGDGDMDVVAGSWNNFWQDPKRKTLIWYENDGKEKFTRHDIAREPLSVVSIALEDISGNGKLDIVAGVLRMDILIEQIMVKAGQQDKVTKRDPSSRVVMFENLGLKKAKRSKN